MLVRDANGDQFELSSLTLDGKTITSSMDWKVMSSLFKYSGVESGYKYGRATLPADTWTTVCDQGGTNALDDTSVEACSIVSTSADDVSAGTGVRTVAVYGCDANCAEISEIITMNGITPVSLVNQYKHVYRLRSITAGTNSPKTVPIGNITVTGDVSSTVKCQMLSENGNSFAAYYVVPAGKTMLATSITVAAARAEDALFDIQVQLDGADSSWTSAWALDVYQSAFTQPFEKPIYFPEKTKIMFLAKTPTTADVTASWGYILIDNTLLV